MEIVSEYVRCLTDDEKVSYFSKLMQLGFSLLEDDPFLVENWESKEHLEKWSHSIETWPEVEFGNIYMFLIDCPGYTHKALKTFKSLPAYNLYANGCLHRLYIRHSPTGHSVIMGRVNRSQDHCVESHRAWVGFNHEDGSIICGHCTCMAGDSSSSMCSHAVAILFQVEAAPRGGYQPRDCSCCFHTVSKEPEEQLREIVSPTVINITLDNGHITFAGGGEDKCRDDEEEKNSKNFVTVLVHSEVDGQAACEEINLKALEDVSMKPVEIKLEEGTTVPALSQNLETEDIVDEDPTPVEILPPPRPPESPIKTEGHGKDLNQIESRTESSNCTVLENHQDTNSVVERESLNGADDNGQSTSSEKTSNNTNETSSLTFPSNIPDSNNTQCQDNEVHFRKLQTETHPRSQPHSCSQCNRNFKSLRSFSLHIKTHPERKPFICQECGKRFCQKYSLKIHTRIHTGQNPFQCSECDKCFRKSSYLRRHIISHRNVKKAFTCTHCGKGFRSAYVASLHKAKHSTDKLYQCAECSESFKRRIDLKQHMISHPTGPSFKCSECHQLFKSNPSLYDHMRLHTGGLPYKCQLCDKTFMQRYQFRAHRRTHTEERPYKCKECGKTFKTKCGLRDHARIHTGERPFQCNQCNKNFSRENCLRKHTKTVHEDERPFMCDECGKSFPNVSDLRKHMWIHAKVKPFTCKECGRGFSSNSSLVRHVRIHRGEFPYLCGVCGLRIRCQSGFSVHMRLHTEERPYKCIECDKRFNQSHQLRSHMKQHQTGKKLRMSGPSVPKFELKFNCKECGGFFPLHSVCDMNLYTVTPTGEKIFHCTVCNGSFSDFLALLEHLNLHRKVVPLPNCSHHSPNQMYKCHACEKSFASCWYRRRHVITVHTGEKNYKCPTCGKGFINNDRLEGHMRSHTGEKPFVCSTCGRAFSFPSNLNRHKLIHTGERPYKCSQCDKDFNQKNCLTMHMRTHTGEKPHKCIICDQAFSEKRGLHRHMQKTCRGKLES